MKKIVIGSYLVCFCLSVALKAEIVDPIAKSKEQMPNKTYTQVVGLGERPVVNENSEKVVLDKIDAIKNEPAPAPAKPINNEYVDGYILSKIKERKEPTAKAGGTEVNLLAIPKTAIATPTQTTNTTDTSSLAKTEVKEVLLVRCVTDKDYQINTDTKIDMFCKNLKKDGNEYKLSANLKINNKTTLVSTPYMLEDTHGIIYKIDATASRLFNGTSGSQNLATYVDMRQIEKINKATSSAFATQAPTLAKEYLNQKQKADTVLSQSTNGLSTTQLQSTTNPKPEVADYGFTLLISMLGDGVKAGVDSLYMDLGYIYFIPKNSVIDGELTVIKSS